MSKFWFRSLSFACLLALLPSGASMAQVSYGTILAAHARAQRQANNNPGYCDYSAAAQHGGWGWNPVKQTSCAPVNGGGYCDFSNAGSNDGWGWNPATQQSCR